LGTLEHIRLVVSVAFVADIAVRFGVLPFQDDDARQISGRNVVVMLATEYAGLILQIGENIAIALNEVGAVDNYYHEDFLDEHFLGFLGHARHVATAGSLCKRFSTISAGVDFGAPMPAQ
jgi:hypothetical protein